MKHCPNCGAPMSEEFVRVFGDNENNVPGCGSCLSFRELQEWPKIDRLAQSIE